MKISVVLPEKNQGKKLLSNLKGKILPYFDAAKITYDVIISPNGCSSEEMAYLESQKDSLPAHVRILENGLAGKGNGVKQGILASDADYVMFMDADCATGLEVFDSIKPMLGKADCICASRDVKGAKYGKKQPLHRRVSHFVSRFIIASMFRLGIKDTQCGYKVFRSIVAKEMVKHQIIDGFAFDVEYLLFLRKNGFKIEEVPCTWTDDADSTIKSGGSVYIKFMRDLHRIRKNRKAYLLSSEQKEALLGGRHVN